MSWVEYGEQLKIREVAVRSCHGYVRACGALAFQALNLDFYGQRFLRVR